MPVHLNIPKHAVEAKVVDAFERGLPKLASEILDDCNQYCKEDSHTLIASSQLHSRPEEGLLIWQTPYARRQYWEIQTAYTDVNSNATWKWCEVAKRHNVLKWKRQAQRLLEMNL